MKKATLIAAGLLAISASSSAQSLDQVVTISSSGGELVGSMMLPDGEPAPVVLLLHGFTGSRNELSTEFVSEGVFARTATRLAEAGYASLRIDFRGSGESTEDLTFADTTFEGQVADALAALDYLEASDDVDSEDIFMIGWSQGGLVATAAAGRSDKPDALALWAAVANPEETFGGLLGADVMAAGKAAAPGDAVSVTLPWGLEIELKGRFFDGIETFDVAAELASYDGPLLVVQGTKDTAVLPASADILIAAHDGPEKLWTHEMDHVFNTFTDDEALEAMIGVTIDYFDANAD